MKNLEACLCYIQEEVLSSPKKMSIFNQIMLVLTRILKILLITGYEYQLFFPLF